MGPRLETDAKRRRVFRVDLLAYILATQTFFWALMMFSHAWLLHPFYQVIVIVMFSIAWFGLTMSALLLRRVRVVRTPPPVGRS